MNNLQFGGLGLPHPEEYPGLADGAANGYEERMFARFHAGRYAKLAAHGAVDQIHRCGAVDGVRYEAADADLDELFRSGF